MTSIYSTGTVSVSNGSATVTGSGTAWAVALISGGIFSSAGLSVPILSVDSDTSLTLAYDWPGTTATGAVYAIARENSEAADIVDLNDKLSRVLVTLSLVGITPNASGTIAERDALTLAIGDKGFLFLHAELGYDFEFYRWSGSAWEGPFATRGEAGLGTGGTIEGLVHAATSKATPVDTDEMALVDSAASWGLKKLTWANLKGGIWTAWGALINGGTAKTTPVDADLFAIADSAASNATKKLTWANLKATLKAYTDTLYLSTTLARREVLTANRTYYVRTDGSDSNNGLANTSAGAFLTIQKAVNVVAALDISIFTVTIQVATGTYTGGVAVNGPWIGSGNVIITGDTSTPTNVVWNVASGFCLAVTAGGRCSVGGFSFNANGAGAGALTSSKGGVLTLSGNCQFGAVTNAHIYPQDGGFVNINANYSIAGNAAAHLVAESLCFVRWQGRTVTLIGTLSFSTAFVSVAGGQIISTSNTFSGTAPTGTVRYSVIAGGVINTFGSGVNYFPGSSAGTTASGGQYI